MGVGGVAFTAFNCIVGAGIFGLPGIVAGILGASALYAYLVCLVLVALVALCFAEAGSRVPAAGGLYAYASAAFGPVAGGVAGALFFIANAIGSSAALARFFIDTLATVWPPFGQPLPALAVLTGIYGTLALINIIGARDGARLSIALGVLKLIPLTLLIVFGAFAVRRANLAWPSFPPVHRIADATLILIFAFVGVESGLGVSGEVRNPSRTIPRAVALALGMVATLYIGLQVVTQGVLGAALATSKAPLAQTAGAAFGPWGTRIMVALTLLSAGGYLAADTLSSPRIAYALARSGQLPRAFGSISPRFGTPWAAILFYVAAVVALAASGTFRQIAVLAVAGTLVLYLICCLGVLRLRAKDVRGAGDPFVAPGGAVVPLAASAMIVWLLSTLTGRELAATAVFVAFAASVYGWTALRSRRAGHGSAAPG